MQEFRTKLNGSFKFKLFSMGSQMNLQLPNLDCLNEGTQGTLVLNNTLPGENRTSNEHFLSKYFAKNDSINKGNGVTDNDRTFIKELCIHEM